jgi:CheY-like chemotaxis protein
VSRILVVDDLDLNRELVRTLLEASGYSVEEAAGGAEAVAAAWQRPFDLILMDLQMPGMDGLAATRAIRATAEQNRATPIVALSANVLPEQIGECLEAGMDDHVAKPIKVAELLEKVFQWAVSGELDEEAAA